MNAFGFHYELVLRNSERSLLLLHGTGGNENDLLPLGRALDDEASLLSPRGQVLENGAPRFFRRLAEGVFDEADVIARANDLARFVKAVVHEQTLELNSMTVVGYSNGANIASAMMLLGLMRFPAAVLFRPMVPLSDPPSVSLSEQRVLISAGTFDPIASAREVDALAHLLREHGAVVDVVSRSGGHELSQVDVESARVWLAGVAIA